MDLRKGRISKSTGSWYVVRFDNGALQNCRLRGKFKVQDLKVTNPIAVGDRVLVQEEASGQGVIVDIEPRENYIIRKSVKKTGHAHLIAANVDRAALVVTLARPKTSLGFIDRFLVSAEAFRIPATLIFNKTDTLNEAGREFQEQLMALYRSIGYSCFAISALTGEGMEALEAHLSKGTTVFSGHSGSGKSTIINRLIPEATQKTQEVSSFANKGVHTTTFAEMFPYGSEAFIIDTPGIKELGLVDMDNQEISHYFPEMRAYLGECRFHNCLHINEPDCAVIAAMERGDIADSRYLSYFSMISDKESHR
jgi:ribosome biogenesis GTPase